MSGPEEIQRKHITPPVQSTVSVPPTPAQTQAPNSVFTSGAAEPVASSSSASGSVSVKPATDASEVSQQSQGTDATKAKQVLDEYIENNNDQLAELSRKEQLDAIRGMLSRKGDLTQEEQLILSLAEAELNSYEKPSDAAAADASDVSKNTVDASIKKVKTESEIRAEQKQKEYQDIYSQEGTAYEKNSRVIDKYLMENDSKYANLKSEKAKKQYRDNLIKSFREQMGLDSNITPAQRAVMHMNIAKLIINAGSDGSMIITPSSNGNPKCNLKKDEIDKKLSQITDTKLSKLLNNIEIDPSKPPKEQLHNIIDKILTETDPNYKKLESEDEKKSYIQKKLGEYTQKMFAVDITKLEDSEKESLELLALAAFKEVKSSGTSIDALLNTDKQQAFIAKVLTKNKKLLDKINDETTKLAFERALQKAEIYNTIRENNPNKKIHEKDILTVLEQMKKDGKIDGNKALEQLYEFYSNAKKMDEGLPDGKKMLDQEANTTSLVGVASLLGMTPEKFISKQLMDDKGHLLPKEKLIENLSNPALRSILGDGRDDVGVKLIQDYLLKQGCSKKEIAEILSKAGLFNRNTLINSLNRRESKFAADVTNGITEYGTEEELADVKGIAGVSTKILTPEDGKAYTLALNDNAYNLIADDFNRGIHTNWSQQQQDTYRNSMVTDINVPQERKSAFTRSYIVTGTAEQQLHDVQYLSKINDSAVTEGLAAAEQFVDASVKSQYSSYLDNAIKNNGYSADEVKNINTARETGQTSYERNSSSTDSTNSSSRTSQPTTTTTNPVNNNSSSTSKTSTASSSGGSAQTKPSASSASSTKVNISPANSNTVSQLRTQLAQLQYEHSIALRDKALDGLQHIIDKIQNDQQVRAQKQAELAAKEAKTDAEISQAIKEAETKSAQEQKKAEEQVAKETLAQIEEQEQLEKKYNIPIEKINKLKSAARNGDLATIYTELGTISADAQKHFVQYLSRKDTATIIGFIRNRSTDKSLIKELCRLNPGLIKSLDSNMLLDCGIAKADIIKYSDSHQLAVLMYDLAKVGNTRELNLFYEALGDDAPTVAANMSQPVPGDDRYFANLYRNMSTASNKVAMRYDIDKRVPRELWG